MSWVVCEQVFDEFSTNSLSLAETSDCNAHQIGTLSSLGLFNSSSPLLNDLFLHDLLWWVLHEESRIADNGLSV